MCSSAVFYRAEYESLAVWTALLPDSVCIEEVTGEGHWTKARAIVPLLLLVTPEDLERSAEGAIFLFAATSMTTSVGRLLDGGLRLHHHGPRCWDKNGRLWFRARIAGPKNKVHHIRLWCRRAASNDCDGHGYQHAFHLRAPGLDVS